MMQFVPELLRKTPQWVCWQKQERYGHMAKLPINARTGRYAKTNDPSTWCNFNTAWVEEDEYDGLGFVLHNEDAKRPNVLCIDLDDCIDSDGHYSPLAQNITQAFSRSYTEISQSGRGIHIFTYGILPKVVKTKSVEMYETGRFIAMTGNTTNHAEISAELDNVSTLFEYCQTHLVTTPMTEETDAPIIPTISLNDNFYVPDAICASGLTYEQVLTKGKYKEKFRQLFEGTWLTAYHGSPLYYQYKNGEKVPDYSRADAALMAYLAFYTGKDWDAMQAIFSISALGQREKWLARKDYQERTILFAVNHTHNTYNAQWRMTQSQKGMAF